MTLQIILDLILIALGIYLAFFKTYNQKKSKNMATLEVMEQVASKIKILESKFIDETKRFTLNNPDSKRNDIRSVVEKMNKQLDELKKELDRINDRSGLEAFFSGLFGSDGGAGEVSDNDMSYLSNLLTEMKVKFLLLALREDCLDCPK